MGYSLTYTGDKVQELLDKIENSKGLTSINGLGGGKLSSPLIITGGDGSDSDSVPKLILDQEGNGQITDNGTDTLFGFLDKGVLTVGGKSYSLSLRGRGGSLFYNDKQLAFIDDTPKGGVVNSINGKQGEVTLTASDIGALPSTTNFVSSINGSAGAITGIATTAQVEKKYTKPSGGIPKADFTSEVQASLDKADTAFQGNMTLTGNTLYITLNSTAADVQVANPTVYNDIY